jgi:predicted Zn-dependent protease
MTTEQIAAVVGAVVLCLGNLAAWIKTATDVAKQKADRLLTKQTRDADSQELHDTVLKLSFQVDQNKGNIGLLFDQMTDQLKQIGLLNTQLAQVLTKMDALCDAIKELKDEVKDK